MGRVRKTIYLHFRLLLEFSEEGFRQCYAFLNKIFAHFETNNRLVFMYIK